MDYNDFIKSALLFHKEFFSTLLASDRPAGTVKLWINLPFFKAYGATVGAGFDFCDYDNDCNQCNHNNYIDSNHKQTNLIPNRL